MSSSEPATLSLRSRFALTELAVADADFRTVAQGIGTLDTKLPPGLYQLEWRVVGPALESKFIELRAGQSHQEHALDVAMPAVAPVAGTTTTASDHEAIAAQASGLLEVPKGQAGVVIMVRCDPREGPMTGIDKGLDGVALGRPNGVHRALEWAIDPDDGWATAAAAMPAGPYALRAPRTGLPDRLRPELEQSLWLPAGFKTLVFVPWASGQPRFADASVHVIPADAAWAPEAPEAAAVEQLLWSLRTEESFLEAGAAEEFLAEHPEPMGDLLAAHLELRRSRPDTDRLDAVLERLEAAVPGHPDLLALRWMARVAEPADSPPSRGPSPLRWPPMLRAGYEGATRLDGQGLGVFRDGSPAVSVCARLFIEGVWTAWHPSGDAEPLVADRKSQDDGVVFQDPATRRVERYFQRVRADALNDAADEGLDESTQDVAYYTGLPAAAVARALTDIEATTPPPKEEPASEEEVPEEPPRPRVPPADAPPTDRERALRWVVEIAGVVFGLTGLLALVTLGTGGSDARAVIALLAASRSATLAMVCRYAAADVRRRGAVIELAAAALVIEALAVALLPWVLAVDEVKLLGFKAAVSDIAGAVVLTDLALALALHWSRSRAYRGRWQLQAFTPANHRTIAAVAECLELPRPPISPEEAALNSDAYLAKMPKSQRWMTRRALWVVFWWPLLRLGPPFTSLTAEQRRKVIDRQFLGHQRLAALDPPLRSALRIAHQLASLGYYSDLRVWDIIGVKAPDGGAPEPFRRRPPAVTTRSAPRAEDRLTVDAVVVGSGAAGALMAYRLAERGLKTLIVERGADIDPYGVPDSQFQSFPELFAEDAFSIVREFGMRVVQSASLGGATREASPVWSEASRKTVARWNESGIDAGIDIARFERALDQVEAWLPGSKRPTGELSTAVDRFVKGTIRMGLQITRSSQETQEAGRQTDDLSAQSVAVLDTLIPWAQRRFGERLEIMPRCHVESVLVEDGEVTGIGCTTGGRKLRVNASTVVLAAGAIHSSEILRESGIKRNVGLRLSFDLSSGMTASFPEVMDAFRGVQLATAVDLGNRQFVAETVWQDPAKQALSMPGWFAAHTANMLRYRHMMAVRVHFGADRTGSDLLLPFRRPSANIRLRKQELQELLELMRVAGEVLLAAGAEYVMPHTLTDLRYTSASDLRRIVHDVRSSSDISVTARPQGGNPISRDPEQGVVGPDLAVHRHPNLLVCDASVFPTSVIRNPRLVAMALAEYAAAGLE